MVMVGYGHQGEEAFIYVAYFKIICAMRVERRDKGSALFHIIEKLEYSGVYLFYLILHHNRLWVLVRTASGRGGSNVYPQSIF